MHSRSIILVPHGLLHHKPLAFLVFTHTTSLSIIHNNKIKEAGCPTILKLSAHYKSASFSFALPPQDIKKVHLICERMSGCKI
jgi:hypothetical protein